MTGTSESLYVLYIGNDYYQDENGSMDRVSGLE